MNRHLSRYHHTHHEKLVKEKEKAVKRKHEDDKKAPIFNLHSKKMRQDFVSNTITNWAKPEKSWNSIAIEKCQGDASDNFWAGGQKSN